MNNKEQAIILITKATSILDEKKGKFTLTFHDNTTMIVRVLNINSKLIDNTFSATLTTYNNDIDKTTDYDIYNLKDIS